MNNSPVQPRILNHSTPITIGLVLTILTGVIANVSYMHTLEVSLDEKLRQYVTKELFDARMETLSAQITALRDEVRRAK